MHANGLQQQKDEASLTPTSAAWQLSRWRKVAFGLAAPPLQMTSNIIGFFFSLFLLEVAHLTPQQVSAIMMSGRVWDALTDPLVGQLLFRTRTKIGRTRPWLLLATPCGCATFFGLWLYLPEHISGHLRFAYYMIAYLLFCTFITCYHVPYTASTVLISPNSKDKDDATAARIGCDLLFTVLSCGLFGFVTGSKRTAVYCNATIANYSSAAVQADSDIADAATAAAVAGVTQQMILQERQAYMIGGAIISLLFLACGCVGCLFISEKVSSNEADARGMNSLLANVKAVLRFKPYLLLMTAFLLMSLAIQTVQANLALFTTHSIGLGKHTQFGILCVLLIAVLCVPGWHFLSARIGKKHVFFIGLLPLLPCLAFGTFMPSKSLASYYSLTGVSGLSISVAMLLPWSMLPDVIDDHNLRRGARLEATFYSLYVFFTKFAAGISLAVSQLVLAAADYDSYLCVQPESVGIALRVLIGPGPIILLLLSLIIIYFYPIDKSYRIKMDLQLSSLSKSSESGHNGKAVEGGAGENFESSERVAQPPATPEAEEEDFKSSERLLK